MSKGQTVSLGSPQGDAHRGRGDRPLVQGAGETSPRRQEDERAPRNLEWVLLETGWAACGGRGGARVLPPGTLP